MASSSHIARQRIIRVGCTLPGHVVRWGIAQVGHRGSSASTGAWARPYTPGLAAGRCARERAQRTSAFELDEPPDTVVTNVSRSIVCTAARPETARVALENLGPQEVQA